MNIRIKKILLIVWLAACTGIFIYWLVGTISGFQNALDWLSKLDNADFVEAIGQTTAANMRNSYNDNLIQLSVSLCLNIAMYTSIAAMLILKIMPLFRKNVSNH